MPGTSASHMIFFIASMIVATAVAGIFVTTVINLAGDIREAADDEAKQFNTQVTIINDPSAMPYNDTCSTLVLYVKNIGSNILGSNTVTILINGTYFTRDNMTFRLLDGATEWGKEVVLEITLTNITLATGDHSLKLIVQGKESVVFKFKI
ncbi:MAG: flagellar protein G [Euryarchaeota archaeon]|nr:flagellar protein G [Euryarchaeota archaeon]